MNRKEWKNLAIRHVLVASGLLAMMISIEKLEGVTLPDLTMGSMPFLVLMMLSPLLIIAGMLFFQGRKQSRTSDLLISLTPEFVAVISGLSYLWYKSAMEHLVVGLVILVVAICLAAIKWIFKQHLGFR